MSERAAIVTGGASGIGAACATRLAGVGFEVTSFDVGPAPRSSDQGIRYEQVDVTDTAAVTAAVRAVEERGPVGAVVNAAGIRGGDETVTAIKRLIDRLVQPAEETRNVSIRAFELVDDDAFRRMFDVHLLGTFAVMRAVLPAMVDRGSGSVVNISSICGILGCEVVPHYSAVKAGMIGLTRSVARDVSRSGVRVNVVAPGYVRTPMMRQMSTPRENDLLYTIPMGRFAEAEEIARAVQFLATDESSYVTGQVISPNGGMVMQ